MMSCSYVEMVRMHEMLYGSPKSKKKSKFKSSTLLRAKDRLLTPILEKHSSSRENSFSSSLLYPNSPNTSLKSTTTTNNDINHKNSIYNNIEKQLDVFSIVMRYIQDESTRNEQLVEKLKHRLRAERQRAKTLERELESAEALNHQLFSKVKRLKQKLIDQKQYFIQKLTQTRSQYKNRKLSRYSEADGFTYEDKQEQELLEKVSRLLNSLNSVETFTTSTVQPHEFPPAAQGPLYTYSSSTAPVHASESPRAVLRSNTPSPRSKDQSPRANSSPRTNSQSSLTPTNSQSSLHSTGSSQSLLKPNQSPGQGSTSPPSTARSYSPPPTTRSSNSQTQLQSPKQTGLSNPQNSTKIETRDEDIGAVVNEKSEAAFAEFLKCPKCNGLDCLSESKVLIITLGTFEKRANLSFSMCSCGYVYQHSIATVPEKPKSESSPPPPPESSIPSPPPPPPPLLESNEPTNTSTSEKKLNDADTPPAPPAPPQQLGTPRDTPRRRTPRVKVSTPRDSDATLMDEIKASYTDSETRLSALEKAKQEMQTRQAERKDPMGSIFAQIKQLKPNSERRMNALTAADNVRKVALEYNRTIIDRQLQLRRSTLKSVGIDKIEETRRQRDKEFFALIPSIIATGDYGFDDVDDEDFDVSDVELADSDSDESGDLMTMLTNLITPKNSSKDTKQKNELRELSSEEDFSSMISSLMKSAKAAT